MKRKELNILKLHVGKDGQLWSAFGLSTPQCVQTGTDEFIDSLAAKPVLHVRMLGTEDNADILATLYTRYGSRTNTVIEVASPAICHTSKERDDAEIALYRMRQCVLPPSLGGWHRYDYRDHATYKLVALLNRKKHFDDECMDVLREHPVYPSLSFLPRIEWRCVARVVAAIRDPRWFVDYDKPHRLSKLRDFMGLTPKVVGNVYPSPVGGGPRMQRCRSVIYTWYAKQSPSKIEMVRPEYFLWRVLDSHTGEIKGVLNASRVFLTYMAKNWEQILVQNNNQELEMFVPEQLLKGQEVVAYKKHMEGCYDYLHKD